MTSQEALADALRQASCILFDFDGPVCNLFAAPPGEPGTSLAPRIAEDLKKILGYHEWLDDAIVESDDPLAVYRFARSDKAVSALREVLDERELHASRTAKPTPGANALITELRAYGKRLAVVSNNSEAAIRCYMERTGLDRIFDGPVIGRSNNRELLKPHPYCLDQAMMDLGVKQEDCLMIGDSPSDAQAALQAGNPPGVPFCGYATNEEQRNLLRDAGAAPQLIVADLHAVGLALAEYPRPSKRIAD
ncbi:HAD family hydrolase [Streptomyces sp. NPDC055722]